MSPKNTILISLASLCVLRASARDCLAQDLTPRAKPQDTPVAIIHATIHPISEAAFEDGFIIFTNGKINGFGTYGKMAEQHLSHPAPTPPPGVLKKIAPAGAEHEPPDPEVQAVLEKLRAAARAQGIDVGNSSPAIDRKMANGETTLEFTEPVEVSMLATFLANLFNMEAEFADGGLAGQRVSLSAPMTMDRTEALPFLTLLLQLKGYTLQQDEKGGKLIIKPDKSGAQNPHIVGWRIIDAKGLHIYPGLIGANSQLGLEEMQSIRSSTDHTETGGVTPEVRAITAINPDSTLLPVTRSAGELITAVFPKGGVGGAIPGRVGVIRLDGWTVPDMTIREDAGLVINWPMTRTISASWMNKTEDEQKKDNDKSLRVIEDMISGAHAYLAAKQAGKQPATDIRYEAMQSIFGQSALGIRHSEQHASSPNAESRMPNAVFIEAQDYDQIQQSVTLCAKYNLRCVIVGARDAPMCADLLKRHNVSVIVSGTYKFPKRDDSPYDDAFTLPARLEAAGVKWCFASGEETAHERNLAPAAGMAVAYGLDHEAALRSITLSAAEILGISANYGSLAIDKSATLILTDGDILDSRTHVTQAFLDGREVNLSDKQKALDQRYREKYKLK